jgi:succinyl-diaminopimelate desuccinylase
VVPDACRLEIDIRTVPGQDHSEILADINRLLKEIAADTPAKFELAVLNDKPSVRTPVTHEVVGHALVTAGELFRKDFQPSGVRYFTDASVFVPGAGGDLPVIIYGPGDEKMAHQPDEFVEISKYLDAIKFYKAFALRCLT